MPGIRIKEHENFESAMRRFKRVVEKSGILSEMRKREHYQPPSDKRKRALAAAVKRFRKKQQRDFRTDRGGRRGSSARAGSASKWGQRSGGDVERDTNHDRH